ncbi:MAG: hypothetical protein K0S34_996 [Bacillales bacterium]|jgi:hypothetical protein|nr:hypothetical protein [Bacillales bacterium]
MLKNSELFQPSLEEGWNETKTYDINRLFYVAFFGGTIPTIILGTRNAKWLNIPKNHINLLIFIGVLLTIVDFILIYLYASGFIPQDSKQFIKLGIQFLAIILFFLYRFALIKPFQQHMVTNGEVIPILKPAILWVLFGAICKSIVIIMIAYEVY